MKKHLIIYLLISCSYLGKAQPIDTTHITYSNALQSLEVLKELLAIPNDANFPKDIEKNVQWCIQKLQAKGFATQQLPTSTVPLLLATQKTIGKDKPTLLFYFHIDGQPIDPSFWFQENPYEATLKEEQEGEGWTPITWDHLKRKNLNPEWRIFARSSSDDKSPFTMFLAALTTIQNSKQPLPYHLKIILDFEEEKGSPNLAETVAKYKEDLQADMLLIFDGPKHPSNQPTISFALW